MAPALPPAEAGLLRRLLLLAVVAVAAGVAGGWLLYDRGDDGEDDESIASWSTCVNPVAGFSIDYPAGWYTAHPALEFACTYFDPRPFELARDADWAPTALQVVLGGGNRAVGRFERSTADGMQQYGHVIQEAGRRFAIFTTFNQGVDYSSWKRIVDRAAGSLVASEQQAATTEGNLVPAQIGLPEPVARKRAEIWKAARARDYEALARLVDPDGFEYTFGGAVPGGPAAYWRQIDRTTEERPIETLVAILELPFALQPESNLYVWPDAFTRQASTLLPEQRKQLADAIGDEALRLYEQLGNYLGYRAGIDEDGGWVFYVAGD